MTGVYEFIDAEYATCDTAPGITRMCAWLDPAAHHCGDDGASVIRELSDIILRTATVGRDKQATQIHAIALT